MRSMRLSFLRLFALCMAYRTVSTQALPLPTSNVVICTKADWRNLLLFFLVNYASHAATVILPPGAKPVTSITWIVLALLFPLSGLGRAIGLLLAHPQYAEHDTLNNPDLDEVRRAALRGAFIVVGRMAGWRPATTHREEVYLTLIQKPHTKPDSAGHNSKIPRAQIQFQNKGPSPEIINKHTHSFLNPHLPDHYELCGLDHNVLIQLLQDDPDALRDAKTIPLGRSQSWPKMIISIVQIVASSITLYRSRGSQIDRYGYAAFGLTVFPYALMSLINAICLGVLGDYATLYILQTQVFHEAKKRQEGSRDPSPTPQEESTPAPSRLPEFLSGPLKEGLLVSAQTLTNEQGDSVLSLKDSGQEERFTLLGSSFNDDTDSYIFGIGRYLSRLPNNEIKSNPDLHGDVGRSASGIKSGTPYWKKKLRTNGWSLFVIFASFLGFVVPYLFLFALTGFHAQKSTLAQRAWITSWLVGNQIVGFLVVIMTYGTPVMSFNPSDASYTLLDNIVMIILIVLVLFAIPIIPAFGAIVMVSKMFLEFGSCSVF